jgi:anti-sigma B factor antagonist
MADDALVIRAYEESDRYVLVLSGELDMGGVPAFEAAAVQLCSLGASDILVDITKIDFIDSSGLRAILLVKAACEERGCTFSMSHGSDQAEKLFELTRLVDRLPFRKSGVTRQRREIDLSAETAGGGEEPGPETLR